VVLAETLLRELACVVTEVDLKVADVMCGDRHFDFDGAARNVGGCEIAHHVVGLVCPYGISADPVLVLGLLVPTESKDCAWAPGHSTIVVVIPWHGLRHPAVAESSLHSRCIEYKEKGPRHRGSHFTTQRKVDWTSRIECVVLKRP
jgi:hypothetical protein